MGLYTLTEGQGVNLLLIHGWALHGGVWNRLTQSLAPSCRTTIVDLPGHGRSREIPLVVNPSVVAEQLMALMSTPVVIIGWSLGALIALTAALDYPDAVAKLVLVGASPKFVQAPDWKQAMPVSQLAQFAADLETDYAATLQRFLSLQIGEGPDARATVQQLRQVLSRHGDPHPEALRAGLQLLRDPDLRPRLAEIQQPVLVMQGSRDRLTPVQAGEALAAMLPEAQFERIESAGHAPFLSHESEFIERVKPFLYG